MDRLFPPIKRLLSVLLSKTPYESPRTNGYFLLAAGASSIALW
jgi:hypothetical protein